MAYKLNMIYPRGGGGSWLSNLIWHLETREFSSTRVEKVFDGQSQSKQVKLLHGIEFDTNPPTIYHDLSQPHLLFSSKHPFNHFLLIATKVQYHLQKIHSYLDEFQQFCLLTDTAVFVLTNELYKKYFYRDADLIYHDIFLDPDRFLRNLYDLLDQSQIQYSKNDNFVFDSINRYRETCDDPRAHFGNVKSLIWLGFCHALIMIDNISMDNIVLDAENFASTVARFNDYCVDRGRELTCFYN